MCHNPSPIHQYSLGCFHMWWTDVWNPISLKRTEKAMKSGRRNKMSGAFSPPTDLWPLWKCFHVLCLTRSRAKKENILSSKPHATDSFGGQINQPRVSDHVTLFRCFVLFPTYPVSTPSIPALSHTHAHSEFPFPVRQITWTGNGVLQRNMLGQENRKESSRVSNMKCSQSQGETRRSWRRPIYWRQGSD